MLANGRWALALAWDTSPKLLALVTVLHLGRGAIPPAMALAVRGLINATVAVMEARGTDMTPLLPWLAAGLFLTLLEVLTGEAVALVTQRLREDLDHRVSSDILAHAATLDLAQFEDPAFQDVVQRATANPAARVASLVTELLNGSSTLLQIAGLLAILIFIEPWLLPVMAVFSLPFVRFQWQLATRRHALEHSRAEKRRWSSYFAGHIMGRASVPEVKMLGLAPLLIQKFRALLSEFRAQDRKLHLEGFNGRVIFGALITASVYALFVHVAYRVLTGALTLGDLAIFGGATTRLRNALQTLILTASGLLEHTLFIGNLTEFFAARPRLVSGAGPGEQPGTGEVELRHVGFTYPGSREPALADINLRIARGEIVAFVGANGAGKTTLMKVIARLYDPDQGAVFLDGTDLRDLSTDCLRDRISFVFQSFGRYQATAAENIAYGDWEELLGDRARVEEIARLAGAHEMIESLPQGYDTMLGRMFGEHDLSGGQWQQIAVARAFARKAELFILDEPTSNLDARAEYELFQRFRALAHGRTTIIVSHRFSTVRMANRIFVMDRGRITESGTHEELLSQRGHYAELHELHRRRMAEP